jgi:hypothetical protein
VDDMSAADLMKRVEQIYQDRLKSELELDTLMKLLPEHPDDAVVQRILGRRSGTPGAG